MNNRKDRKSLEARAARLGLELTPAWSMSEKWSTSDQPGPNRWTIRRRRRGQMYAVISHGTLADVSLWLDCEEVK